MWRLCQKRRRLFFLSRTTSSTAGSCLYTRPAFCWKKSLAGRRGGWQTTFGLPRYNGLETRSIIWIFPETIAADPRLYLDLLLNDLECFLLHGFRRLILFNGHCGNIVPSSKPRLICVGNTVITRICRCSRLLAGKTPIPKIIETTWLNRWSMPANGRLRGCWRLPIRAPRFARRSFP